MSSPPIAEYRTPGYASPWYAAMIGGGPLVLLVVVLFNPMPGESGWSRLAFGLTMVLMASVSWWWLVRLTTRVSIRDGALFWRSAVASGSIPLAELSACRPRRWGGEVQVFEHAGGRPVLVMIGKGFRDFLAEVQAACPDLDVRSGRQARMADWWPGRSGFSGRDDS